MIKTATCLIFWMMMRMRQPEPSQDKKQRVLVGLSGGMDSAVASLFLKEKGYAVTGLFLVTHDEALEKVDSIRALCQRLAFPLVVADVRDRFKKTVIDHAVEAWFQGLTPNPCTWCNANMKFKVMMEEADREQCALIATGHYASVKKMDTGRLALCRTQSGNKDQTYFLYRLTQEQLARLVFPLANHQKDEIRKKVSSDPILREDGQSLVDLAESQELCFLPDKIHYTDVLRREAKKRGMNLAQAGLAPGPMVDREGHLVGAHKGLAYYTIGQRRGLAVPAGQRLFVIEKHRTSNTLVVGSYEHVLRQSIRVRSLVFSKIPAFQEGQKLQARIRSMAPNVPCRVYPQHDGTVHVIFDQPIAAPAPGQSCVFYDSDCIASGGIIEPG
jgi:tRNA-uridine 2-sulfurtransferase